MRRNGENLLVLAGEEPGRRWSQPVPLIDVLRAAASEVEQYERVTLRDLPTVEVAGRAVNDVVHLVAELLENATSFSAPETKVSVTGNLLNTGGVMLEIEDSGIGMTPEELDDSNERLANPPVVDVAISRRMGLFVVGRLATRHGIQVRLRRSATGGITALVLVPAALLAGNLSDAPAVGGNRAGTFGDIADTGQLPQLTSTGLPRRPGGAVRAEQRELPSPDEPQGPPNQAPASLPPFGGERVPTAGANGGDGWEDVSAAAPPYRGTDATPPGLADLLAETEAMSQGVTPMIREGDPGDPGSSGSHVRPDFVLPEPELDGRLAEALDGTATYDFRPNSAPAAPPNPPANPENTGQFRISAGSDDMRLDFRVGEPAPATPPPPPQAPPAPPSLDFSSSFDDLLPNIPEMEHTGEFAAYRETRDERDDLLLPPPSNPYAAPGQNPQAPSAGGFGSNAEQLPGSGLNNDLGAELAAGDPFAAPGEVRMTPFGGHVDSGFGDRGRTRQRRTPRLRRRSAAGSSPAAPPTARASTLRSSSRRGSNRRSSRLRSSSRRSSRPRSSRPRSTRLRSTRLRSTGQNAPTGDPMASGGLGAPSGTGYGNDAPSFGRRPMGEPLSGPGFDAPRYGEQQSAPTGDGPGDPMAGLRNPFTAPEAPAGTGYGNDAPSFGRRPMGEPLSGPGFDAPQYGEQAPAADLSGSGFHTRSANRYPAPATARSRRRPPRPRPVRLRLPHPARRHDGRRGLPGPDRRAVRRAGPDVRLRQPLRRLHRPAHRADRVHPDGPGGAHHLDLQRDRVRVVPGARRRRHRRSAERSGSRPLRPADRSGRPCRHRAQSPQETRWRAPAPVTRPRPRRRPPSPSEPAQAPAPRPPRLRRPPPRPVRLPRPRRPRRPPTRSAPRPGPPHRTRNPRSP